MYNEEKYSSVPRENAFSGEVRSGSALNSFINRVFGWMFAGLAMTGGLAWYLGNFQVQRIVQYHKAFWIFAIAEFLVVIALSAGMRKINAMTAALLFAVFALLNGVTLSWIFIAYSTAVIAKTFFATSCTFGFMGLLGYLTRKDLSGIGSICFMGLIGIIIASVINMIWYNGTADLIISCIGVLIFAGLTAWDVQKIKLLALELAETSASGHDVRKYAVFGALELYLDFINLFIMLLRIFGGSRK
jgi:FtsH-binding integral membrane protein